MGNVDVLKESGIETITEALHVKGLPDLFVGVLRDKQKFIKSKLIKAVATAFRDIYGHGKPVDNTSWGEYLKCTTCGENQSIEDFYELDTYEHISELEKNGIPKNISCPSCKGEMELFWPSDKLIDNMIKQFSEKILFLVTLHDAQGNIYGFEYGFKETIKQAWEDTISKLYKNSSLNYEEYLRQINQKSNGKLKEYTEVIHLVEVGQTLPSRGKDTFYNLLGTFLNDSIPKEIRETCSGITATQKGLNAYLISKLAEWGDICEVDDSKTVVLEGNIENMSEATKEKSAHKFLSFYINRRKKK